MSDYSLLKQVYMTLYACASVCDEATEAALEDQVATRSFPYGNPPRNRLFERGVVAADANAHVVELTNQAVGTLTQFLEWFKSELNHRSKFGVLCLPSQKLLYSVYCSYMAFLA